MLSVEPVSAHPEPPFSPEHLPDQSGQTNNHRRYPQHIQPAITPIPIVPANTSRSLLIQNPYVHVNPIRRPPYLYHTMFYLYPGHYLYQLAELFQNIRKTVYLRSCIIFNNCFRKT
jgi:hypothetical protein